MKNLPFKGKIWRQANSNVVTIPMDYVNNGLLKEGEEYTFTVEVTE